MKLMDKKFSLTKNNGEVVKEINITELAVIPEWWEDEEDFDEDSLEEEICGAYLNINEKDEITIPVDGKGNVSVDGSAMQAQKTLRTTQSLTIFLTIGEKSHLTT